MKTATLTYTRGRCLCESLCEYLQSDEFTGVMVDLGSSVPVPRPNQNVFDVLGRVEESLRSKRIEITANASKGTITLTQN